MQVASVLLRLSEIQVNGILSPVLAEWMVGLTVLYVYVSEGSTALRLLLARVSHSVIFATHENCWRGIIFHHSIGTWTLTFSRDSCKLNYLQNLAVTVKKTNWISQWCISISKGIITPTRMHRMILQEILLWLLPAAFSQFAFGPAWVYQYTINPLPAEMDSKWNRCQKKLSWCGKPICSELNIPT